jgi:hypothetical protein
MKELTIQIEINVILNEGCRKLAKALCKKAQHLVLWDREVIVSGSSGVPGVVRMPAVSFVPRREPR